MKVIVTLWALNYVDCRLQHMRKAPPYMLDCVACKEKRNIILYYFTYFYIILYDFVNCPAFVDIKQILHDKVAIEQLQSERCLFFMHCSLCLFCIFLLDKVF